MKKIDTGAQVTTSPTSTNILGAKRIIVASNRGPVEHFLGEDQTLKYRRSPGGLVTALLSVTRHMQATWISVAMTEGDHLASQKAQETQGIIQSPLDDTDIQLRYVTLPKEVFRKYYSEISTQLLWFTYSYMYDLVAPRFPDDYIQDAWTNGYHMANQAIADAICAEIEREETPPVVMLHDNFLCLVPSFIRKLHPSVLIQQFLHWPWPDLRYLSFLPTNVLEAMYRGLLHNDIIGFQTERDAYNFLDGAQMVLKDAQINMLQGTVQWHGQRTLVRTYPISIAIEETRAIAYSEVGKTEEEKIQPFLDKKVVMRIDRIDPVKNIVTGFRAYEHMLEEHPELRGQVVFMAFLIPTRESVPLYREYKEEVIRTIEEINKKHRLDTWTPIQAFIGNNLTRSLVAMRFYDVLLVNSLSEGMNLVAKEGFMLNQVNGVLALSRTTGVFPQLGKHTISLSPTSITDTAQAIFTALMLPLEERRAFIDAACQQIEQNDLNHWLARQFSDISSILD